jgi:nicotinamidase-related amidase
MTLRWAAKGPRHFTRERAVEPGATGFLVVDVQYDCCARGEGSYTDARPTHPDPEKEAYLARVETTVLPAIRRVQDALRAAGGEVLFTVIESLTLDGRDRSLDHKLSDMHVPRGSRLAKVIDSVGPVGDEIVLPKTSSGVFNSTNIEYVLRNLGVEYLIVAGVFTDQCVDMAVRDAADRGFMVTLVEDGCAGSTMAKHDNALKAFSGYCRIRTSANLVAEIAARRAAAE